MSRVGTSAESWSEVAAAHPELDEYTWVLAFSPDPDGGGQVCILNLETGELILTEHF